MKINCFKIIVLVLITFLFIINSFAFGMDFNDDIQKVILDYYYYEGFGEVKLLT
jgi:hypothetical protein